MPFLITIASTTVKDLFSKVDGPLPPSFSFSPFLLPPPSSPLCHPTRSSPVRVRLSPPRSSLSLLQIGLVVLRVHQDNSNLALCLFEENAAQRRIGRTRGGGRGRRDCEGTGAYCTALRVVYVLAFSRSETRSKEGALNLSLSLSLSPIVFLSRVVTHWISARSALWKLRGSTIRAENLSERRRSLSHSPISRRNCSIVALDATDKAIWNGDRETVCQQRKYLRRGGGRFQRGQPNSGARSLASGVGK